MIALDRPWDRARSESAHRSTCRASFLPSHLGHEADFAMTNVKFNTALIVGAGAGLSASLARALAKDGIKVALAARSTADLDALVKQTGHGRSPATRRSAPKSTSCSRTSTLPSALPTS